MQVGELLLVLLHPRLKRVLKRRQQTAPVPSLISDVVRVQTLGGGDGGRKALYVRQRRLRPAGFGEQLQQEAAREGDGAGGPPDWPGEAKTRRRPPAVFLSADNVSDAGCVALRWPAA